MTTVDEFKEQTNELLIKVQKYFSECSQNERIAWGVIGLGFILIILGTIMLF